MQDNGATEIKVKPKILY